MAAKLEIANINRAAFHLSRIAGLPAVNVIDAFFVRRADKRDGIVGVFFGHSNRGHHQNPVGIHRAGLMGFRAAHHNAFIVFLDDVEKHIRVGLLMGG